MRRERWPAGPHRQPNQGSFLSQIGTMVTGDVFGSERFDLFRIDIGSTGGYRFQAASR